MADVINYVVGELADMYDATESDMIKIVRKAQSILMSLKSDVHFKEEVYHLPTKCNGTTVEMALDREWDSCNSAIYRLHVIEDSGSISKALKKALSLF